MTKVTYTNAENMKYDVVEEWLFDHKDERKKHGHYRVGKELKNGSHNIY